MPHANHPAIVKRLKRADGHLRTIIEMIEDDRPCLQIAQQLQAVESAIENAKKYRVLASLHLLRSHIRRAMAKRGRTMLDCGAAYSTRICVACGGHIEPGSMLLLTCDNGHQNDQDVNAATYFCSHIETPAYMASDAAGISPELQRYLRRLD